MRCARLSSGYRRSNVPFLVPPGNALLGVLLVVAACRAPEVTRTLKLPPRPANAAGGAAVMEAMHDLSLDRREELVYREVARGNVPGWLRTLHPVEVRGAVEGKEHSITFWVAPDYLAVGSDSDYVYVPVTAATGQRVADLVGASLPTAKMVDAIWSAAHVHLTPIRLGPNDSIATVAYYERHTRLIKAQARLHRAPPGAFVAGDKLDIVITPTSADSVGLAALYGWHKGDGQPVQRLYAAHTDSIVVYSEGIRLVDRTVVVDGEERDLWDVLREPSLAPLLSAQGIIEDARYGPTRPPAPD